MKDKAGIRARRGGRPAFGLYTLPFVSLLASVLLPWQLCAADVAKTTVADTLINPDGSKPSGRISISNPATFQSADGYQMESGMVAIATVTAGAFSVALVPNTSASPYYIALYNLGGITVREYWAVPSSLTAVNLATVRQATPPAPSIQIAFPQLNPPTNCFSLGGFPSWTGTAWTCARGGYTFSNPLSLAVSTVSIPAASNSQNGYLSSSDWIAFNAKQAALSFSSPLANNSGTVSIPAASSSQNGYLSSSDWIAFNAKQAALSFSSPLANNSGTVSIPAASNSQNGYLSSADWSSFNGKQAGGVSGTDPTGAADSAAAINAAIAAGSGRKVALAPGTYNISSAQIVFHVSNIVFDCQGSTLIMNVADNGMFLGDAAHPTWYQNITIQNCVFEPGTGSSSYVAVANNGQYDTIINPRFSSNGANRFAAGIRNLDDQNELIIHPMTDAAAIFVCNATTCGAAISDPGPYSTNAGITHVINPAFNLGCSGNGIDYQDANALIVVGGYIQGFSQFAVRSSGGTTQTSLHEERGSCSNPVGNIGAAGNIQMGGSLTSIGGSPSALAVSFTVNGTPGTTNYVYWIVAVETATGYSSVPLPIGYVRTGNATIDGTNNNTVTWPAASVSGITGATYKIIRKIQDLAPPTGTGNWLVATALDEGTYCAAGVCTFTDTVTNPTSFTAVNASSSLFSPVIAFWPGNVTLSPTALDSCSQTSSYDGKAFGSGGSLTNACPYSAGKVNYSAGSLLYAGDYQPLAFTYYWSPTATNEPIVSTLPTGIAPFSVASATKVPNLTIGGNADTATALAATPSQCAPPNVASGIAASGNANCVAPSGLSAVRGGLIGAVYAGNTVAGRVHEWSAYYSYGTTPANSTPMPFSASLGNWSVISTSVNAVPATVGLAVFTNTTATLDPGSFITFMNSTGTNAVFTNYGAPMRFVPQNTPIGIYVSGPAGGPGIETISAEVNGSTSQPLMGNLNGATVGAGVTLYAGFGSAAAGSATEANVELPISLVNGGTVRNVCFSLNTANGASASVTATVRRGVGSGGAMAGTSLAATAGNSAPQFGQFCDRGSGDGFNVANGDRIVIAFVGSGATSGGLGGYSVELAPAPPATGMLVFPLDGLTLTAGAVRYSFPFANVTPASAESLAQSPVPRSLTVPGFTCYVTGAPVTASHVVSFRQNGSSTPGGSLSATITTAFSAPAEAVATGNALTFAQRDLFGLKHDNTGGSTAATFSSCSAEID